MDLHEALQKGAVEGVDEKPERSIETVMSIVYLYKDVVRKVYKRKLHALTGDLRDPIRRKVVYHDDFTWNYAFSPDIHLGLRAVRRHGRGWELGDASNAHDWFIEMRRINAEDTLLQRLLAGRVVVQDMVWIGEQLARELDHLTTLYRDEYAHLFARGWMDLMRERMDDMRSFGYLADAAISRTETDRRVRDMQAFIARHPHFAEEHAGDLSLAIDNHAANVVFVDEKPRFIDICLPKEMWRVVHHANNPCRLAACVRTHGDDALAQALYDAYEEQKALPAREVREFYEAYNGFIKGYYYAILKNPALSERYFAGADALLAGL